MESPNINSGVPGGGGGGGYLKNFFSKKEKIPTTNNLDLRRLNDDTSFYSKKHQPKEEEDRFQFNRANCFIQKHDAQPLQLQQQQGVHQIGSEIDDTTNSSTLVRGPQPQQQQQGVGCGDMEAMAKLRKETLQRRKFKYFLLFPFVFQILKF